MRWLIAILMLAVPVAAQPPSSLPETDLPIIGERGGFIATPSGECWLRLGGLSDLATGARANWNGTCATGLAEGIGVALFAWREGRAVRGMVYQGTMRDGHAHGWGRLTHLRDGQATIIETGLFAKDTLMHGHVEVLADGLVYEGSLRNGLPHGYGRLQSVRGAFDGEWANGCLPLPGGAWVAFLRAPDGCATEED